MQCPKKAESWNHSELLSEEFSEAGKVGFNSRLSCRGQVNGETGAVGEERLDKRCIQAIKPQIIIFN